MHRCNVISGCVCMWLPLLWFVIGKFNGVEVNPTTLIVEELQRQYASDDVNFQILDVSIDGVDLFHQNLTKSNENVCNYYIHLGVSGSATCFNLETCAYNCNDFRVPDESGNQPSKVCISEDRELNSTLFTNLDLNAMKTSLQRTLSGEMGSPQQTDSADADITADNNNSSNNNTMDGGQGQTDQTDVCISTDPGRFLCNYVYYQTLSHCLKHKAAGDKSTGVFVHVPPVEVLPLKRQVDFVLRLLQWVRNTHAQL